VAAAAAAQGVAGALKTEVVFYGGQFTGSEVGWLLAVLAYPAAYLLAAGLSKLRADQVRAVAQSSGSGQWVGVVKAESRV
jgi:hypothetical protein